MCLFLKSISASSKIAEEDIVVYKYLDVFIPVLEEPLHGKDFTAKDVSGKEFSGKISISLGSLFLCSNNARFDGSLCPDRLGYSYSWILDSSIDEVVVDGITIVKKGNIDSIYCSKEILYRTPYRNFPVKIGETYTSDLEKISFYIEKGLHSFKNKKDALLLGYPVVECIIPKGSEYYVGTYDEEVSYASNALKYVKLCV